ncbi:uncharacterized protein V6R79_000533 [Siganus canaliculatus]
MKKRMKQADSKSKILKKKKKPSYHRLSTVQQRSTFDFLGMLVFSGNGSSSLQSCFSAALCALYVYYVYGLAAALNLSGLSEGADCGFTASVLVMMSGGLETYSELNECQKALERLACFHVDQIYFLVPLPTECSSLAPPPEPASDQRSSSRSPHESSQHAPPVPLNPNRQQPASTSVPDRVRWTRLLLRCWLVYLSELLNEIK